MSTAVGILIVLGAAALALAMVALVRHGGGPVLGNPTRGTPMAIVAGTSNAVLLAFVILAAFQTYNSARAGAAAEADAVLDMARTAALFPAAQRDRLPSDFVCYGRAVVNEEWPAMRNGHSSPLVDDWVTSYRDEFARDGVGQVAHQLRHAHAVEMSREGVPLVVIQRQLGHADLGITSAYLRGIDNTEIIHTVHERPAPMIPATNGHLSTS